MQYTKLDPKIQKHLKKIITTYAPLASIIKALDAAGATVLLVGGAVRDLLLDLPLKDIDIEVHNLPLKQLEKLLQQFGPVSLVGKQFGVLRLHGLDVDWAVPRADKPGRKPQVALDPFMGITQACARRDLTINAMAIDLVRMQLLDPFNGLQDLHDGILQPPDPKKFVEDPLRFYRVMQFVARFGMQPTPALNKLCKKMDVSTVSRERIEQECKKWLLKSDKPSVALDWLHTIGRLKELFPEIYALRGVKQNPTWHPEGDVYEHTKQALDAAAQLKYPNEREKLIGLYAALCHDLGKATTTKKIDGVWRSHGHAEVSATLAKKMLKRITQEKDLIDAVSKMAHYHMSPPQFVDQGAKLSAYKRLANKLASVDVTLEMLGNLALADYRGRNKKKGEPLKKRIPKIEKFFAKAKRARVLYKPEEPVLHGRDLMDVVKPGPEMGKLLRRAYEIQIEEGVRDKKILKKWVLER